MGAHTALVTGIVCRGWWPGFSISPARKLGLQSGIDIARGPEDTSIYPTVGSAWRF